MIRNNKIHDSSEDSGEDEEKIALPQRPLENKKQSKNGNLWKAMLDEENLMQEMQTCEVARNRKRKIDRGAESYAYNTNDTDEKRFKGPRDDSSFGRHERKKISSAKRNNNFVDKSPIHLEELNDISDMSDELFVDDVASKLGEDNKELIARVVSTLGRDECSFYFKKTQTIEKNGGLLTVNKQRRRTAGGVFLFLIKTSNKVSHEQKDVIFKQNSEG